MSTPNDPGNPGADPRNPYGNPQQPPTGNPQQPSVGWAGQPPTGWQPPPQQGPQGPPTGWQPPSVPGPQAPPSPYGWGFPPQPPPPGAHALPGRVARPRPWYARPWGIALLVIVALIVLGQAGRIGRAAYEAGSPAATSAPVPVPATSAPTPANASPAPVGIGEQVTAGQWDFTVTKVTCGIERIGDDFLGREAQGQFCLLRVTATNHGSGSGLLLSSNQVLRDSLGNEYEAEQFMGMYDSARTPLLNQDFDPDQPASGFLYYDVPKRAQLASVSLAGGLLTEGVATVELR